MQVLPVDMRLEAFVLGTLTGLMSVSLQMVGLQNIDHVVDSTEQYLGAAADHAQLAILEGQTKNIANWAVISYIRMRRLADIRFSPFAAKIVRRCNKTRCAMNGHTRHHSTTSLARSRIDVGISTPIAFAVFRLIANS
jgi:hypothetical protein